MPFTEDTLQKLLLQTHFLVVKYLLWARWTFWSGGGCEDRHSRSTSSSIQRNDYWAFAISKALSLALHMCCLIQPAQQCYASGTVFSPFYIWRGWDTESFVNLLTDTQVGRSETRIDVGHTDLGAHTLGDCVKMFCLISLWSPRFFRSQHSTTCWQPYQNNTKQTASQSNHPAVCKHFLLSSSYF